MTVAAAVAVSLIGGPGATGASAAPGSSGTQNPIVKTGDGMVQGAVSDGVRSFQGIPFAQAPVGDLRWKAPQPARAWKGVREATEPGPACEQGSSGEGYSEDCLNLNVWTPATASTHSKLPVSVYIYGGAFRSGSNSGYRPTQMVDQGGQLVVTINYRVGALGFLTLPQLDTADHTQSGNFGLLDQMQALKWVKQNIAAFGGDPGRVTIAGQSAGGESTCALLASPKAAGLFHRVVVESGLTCVQSEVEQAQADDAQFVSLLGCDRGSAAAQVACLRSKTPEEVLAAQSEAGSIWYPATGLPSLPQQSPVAFAKGDFNRVPVLIGSTANEGAFFIYNSNDKAGRPVTPESYRADVEATFGSAAPEVLKRYPLSNYSVPGAAEAQMKTDVGFSCATLSNAASLSKFVPTYVYEFRDATSSSNINGGPGHGAELSYLWGTSSTASLTSAQQALSKEMIDYWSAFARSGNLKVQGLPMVPRYAAGHPHELAFDADGSRVVTDEGSNHQCDFWDDFFAGTGYPFHFAPGEPLVFPPNAAPLSKAHA